MVELWKEMTNWIYQYYGDQIFLIMAVGSYLYLFVHCKNTRRKLLYPLLLIVLCLLNPVFYKFIFSKGRYWRFFWTLPNVIVIAYVITEFIRKSKRKWEKASVLIAFVLLIVVKGTNVYKHGIFIKTQNEYKISQDTKNVCDMILSDSDNPKCVMPQELYCETRQYSGHIMQLYGRSAEGGYIIPIDEEQRKIYEELMQPQPDYEFILSKVYSYDCDYLVVTSDKSISNRLLDEYHCSHLADCGNYIIYKLTY